MDVISLAPKWFVLVLISVFTSCLVNSVYSSTVLVDAPFGKIQGLRKTHEATGQNYLSFKGIPYAKPPLNELRFARPQPHPKIDGVFDATKQDRIECPQARSTEQEHTEDCLVLNIRVKDKTVDDSLRKVLVYIHGGAYIMGSSYDYIPNTFVANEDVIVVTINYRIGILGFLSTENEASLGNYGLWDQALAIKWVKDNIRAFGGDPDDITICGESAGGSSVGYQSLSPHSKDLFTRVIIQSATASSAFGQSMNAQSDALGVAKHSGCWDGEMPTEKISVEQSRSVIDCLRTKPFLNITSIQRHDTFVPFVDGDFIPDFPINLLKNDEFLDSIGFFDKSYIVSLNNYEAGIVDRFSLVTKQMIFSNDQIPTEQKEAAWSGYLNMAMSSSVQNRIRYAARNIDDRVLEKVKDFYSRRYDEYFSMVQCVTDVNFLVPSIDFLSACARRESCSSYFLYFDYFPHYMVGPVKGLSHGLDLMYLFDVAVGRGMEWIAKLLMLDMEGGFSEDDFELKRTYSSVIAEFIRTGNPEKPLKESLPSGWPKYNDKTSPFLRFNLKPWVDHFLEKDKQDFWLHDIPKMLEETEEPHHQRSEL